MTKTSINKYSKLTFKKVYQHEYKKLFYHHLFIKLKFTFLNEDENVFLSTTNLESDSNRENSRIFKGSEVRFHSVVVSNYVFRNIISN